MKKPDLDKIYTGLQIASSVLGSQNATTDPAIALAAILDRRFSTPNRYYNSLDSLILMNRNDFPSLKEREEVMVGGRLCTYIYKVDVARGLVLCVHGLNAFSDDYNAVAADYFVRHGYDVVAMDLSASGRSKGIGIKSFSQGAYDVEEVVKFIQKRDDLCRLPLYMFGHSWGTYSVAASLNKVKGVKAVALLSGFDTPLNEMVAMPSKYIGPLSELTADPLEKALKDRAGEGYNLSAIDGINKAKDTKVIIVQGGNDSTVSPAKGSIYSRLEDIKTKPRVLFFKDKGHANIFFDPNSIAYLEQVKEMKAEFKKQHGSNLSKIDEAAIKDFTSSFDKHLTSIPDEAVFGPIIELFK